MKSPIKNFIETNLIMLGLLFYCCEDTQPDSSDVIDAGVVINEINYNVLQFVKSHLFLQGGAINAKNSCSFTMILIDFVENKF